MERAWVPKHRSKEEQWRMMILAAKSGDARLARNLARVLGKEGFADVGCRDELGRDPGHLAAKKGNAEVMKALIEAGWDVESKTRGGASAGHLAAMAGPGGILEILLDAGWDFLGKDHQGRIAEGRATEIAEDGKYPLEETKICARLLGERRVARDRDAISISATAGSEIGKAKKAGL